MTLDNNQYWGFKKLYLVFYLPMINDFVVLDWQDDGKHQSEKEDFRLQKETGSHYSK